MGLSAAAYKASFLHNRLQMQGKDGVGVPVKELVDSQPALAIVYNQMYLARPQQILVR